MASANEGPIKNVSEPGLWPSHGILVCGFCKRAAASCEAFLAMHELVSGMLVPYKCKRAEFVAGYF